MKGDARHAHPEIYRTPYEYGHYRRVLVYQALHRNGAIN